MNSHLTAIARKKPSAPMSLLYSKGFLTGRILDFGCGRGFDVEHFYQKGLDIYGYDSHWAPNKPTGTFDVVTCNYVLNTIEKPFERLKIVAEALMCLNKGGKLFVSIRHGKGLNGHTSRGTWQGYVGHHLRQMGLERIHSEGWSRGFEIYLGVR